ncbi:Pal1 cell morphology protein-domain-containing protein [Rhizoctonia solani]|nr:Pal1 cell morphology protein-domain-containing protein [Rhizoctonia solani]
MDNVVVKNGVPLDATRIKPSRSMTSGPAAHAPQPTNRSLSTDRLDRQVNEKSRKTSPRPPAKKSNHVDVIDKLDYSGIGAATFHHDGPFDACAPSRNKNKTKAPMYAFDDVPLQQAEDVNNKNLSPRAQATIMAMRQSPGSSPYAIALNTEVAKNYGQPPSPTYASKKKQSPKKSALAEAWGIAEPEPFEEFSAGRQSGYEHGSPMNARPLPTRRPSKPMPPPQPIQLYPEFPEGDDPVAMSTAPSAYGARPAGPKRSRSLMQRFRKMRDSPNAPPPATYEEEPPMPPSNDIRLVSQQRAPPVPERGPMDPYSGGARDKGLPSPPVANAEYFEKPHAPVSPGAGINRKGSLMRKVKGVMSR